MLPQCLLCCQEKPDWNVSGSFPRFIGSSTAKGSPEAGEVEGGDDVLAAGGFDFDGGFGRGDVTGVKLQPDDSSAEAGFAAVIEHLGALPEGLDPPAVLG